MFISLDVFLFSLLYIISSAFFLLSAFMMMVTSLAYHGERDGEDRIVLIEVV